MKVFKLEDGTWEWRIRFLGMVGQANGFALTRQQAFMDALNRLDEELLQRFLVHHSEA